MKPIPGRYDETYEWAPLPVPVPRWYQMPTDEPVFVPTMTRWGGDNTSPWEVLEFYENSRPALGDPHPLSVLKMIREEIGLPKHGRRPIL